MLFMIPSKVVELDMYIYHINYHLNKRREMQLNSWLIKIPSGFRFKILDAPNQ